MITQVSGPIRESIYRHWFVGTWTEEEIKNSRIEYVTKFRRCPSYRKSLRYRPWWPLLGKELR